MYLLQNYFDQMKTAEAKKSTNGTVLSKFFEPPKEAAKINLDTKKIGDEMAAGLVEIFKDFEQKHNVKLRFTRKVGRAK